MNKRRVIFILTIIIALTIIPYRKYTNKDKELEIGKYEYLEIPNINKGQEEGKTKSYISVKETPITKEDVKTFETGMVTMMNIDGKIYTYHIDGEKVTVYLGERRIFGTELEWEGWSKIFPYPSRAILVRDIKGED